MADTVFVTIPGVMGQMSQSTAIAAGYTNYTPVAPTQVLLPPPVPTQNVPPTPSLGAFTGPMAPVGINPLGPPTPAIDGPSTFAPGTTSPGYIGYTAPIGPLPGGGNLPSQALDTSILYVPSKSGPTTITPSVTPTGSPTVIVTTPPVKSREDKVSLLESATQEMLGSGTSITFTGPAQKPYGIEQDVWSKLSEDSKRALAQGLVYVNQEKTPGGQIVTTPGVYTLITGPGGEPRFVEIGKYLLSEGAVKAYSGKVSSTWDDMKAWFKPVSFADVPWKIVEVGGAIVRGVVGPEKVTPLGTLLGQLNPRLGLTLGVGPPGAKDYTSPPSFGAEITTPQQAWEAYFSTYAVPRDVQSRLKNEGVAFYGMLTGGEREVASGLYVPIARGIELQSKPSSSTFGSPQLSTNVSTVAHEVAHDYWYSDMPSSLKREFIKEYGQSGADTSESFSMIYGGSINDKGPQPYDRFYEGLGIGSLRQRQEAISTSEPVGMRMTPWVPIQSKALSGVESPLSKMVRV